MVTESQATGAALPYADQPSWPWAVIIFSFFTIISFILYGKSLPCDFFWDDEVHVLIPALPNFHSPLTYFNLNSDLGINHPNRGVTYLSHALVAALGGGLNAHLFRIINLLIHISNAFLIWCIIRAVMRTVSHPKSGGAIEEWTDKGLGPNLTKQLIDPSLLIAFIFLIHPIQSSAVAYIAQRATLLSAFFVLCSFLLYIRSRNGSFLRRIVLRGLSVISFLLALYSKEVVLLFPLFLLLCEVLFGNDRSFKKISLRLIPYFGLVLFYLGFYPFSEMGQYQKSLALSTTPLTYGFTQTEVIWSYFKLLVIPLPHFYTVDHYCPIKLSFFDYPIFVTLPFLFCLVGGLIIGFLFKKTRFISFWVAWYFLFIGPTSSFYPLGETMVEYRNYLPSLGIFSALVFSGWIAQAKVRQYIPASHALRVLFVLLLVSAIGYSCYRRIEHFQSPLHVWNDAVAKTPLKARPYYNRGLLLQKDGKLKEALVDFQKVLSLDPSFVGAASSIGSIFKVFGNLDAARTYYAQDAARGDAIAMLNLGHIHQLLGNYDEAEKYTRAALARDSSLDRVYFNLGVIYQNSGKYREAIQAFEKMLIKKPFDMQTINNIGAIYMQLGFHRRALREFQKAIDLGYHDHRLYANMALAASKLKKPEQAHNYLQQALKLSPQGVDDPLLQNVLALLTTEQESSSQSKQN